MSFIREEEELFCPEPPILAPGVRGEVVVRLVDTCSASKGMGAPVRSKWQNLERGEKTGDDSLELKGRA